MTCQSLLELAVSFDHYFPEKVDPQQGNLTLIRAILTPRKNRLIELSCSATLMSKNKTLQLSISDMA